MSNEQGQPGSASRELFRAWLLAGGGLDICRCKGDPHSLFGHDPECDVTKTRERMTEIMRENRRARERGSVP